jgi:hypothetical protein
MADIDRLVLGVNPFSNVNHYLRESGRMQAFHLNEKRIAETLSRSFEAGATGFNFSANEFGFNLLKLLENCDTAKNIGLYPMIPDTDSYVAAQLSKGTLGMITDVLGKLSAAGRAKAIFQGGLSVLTLDPIRALRIIIDVEMAKLRATTPRNAAIRSVMIDLALTDLLIALKAENVFRLYVDYVQDSYKITPGFVTRNFPLFVRFCKDMHLDMGNILVMAPFNSIGFQMPPTREASEVTLAENPDLKVIAMSALAGGRISPSKSFEYLSKLKNLSSVVIGLSSASHATETFTLFGRIWQDSKENS